MDLTTAVDELYGATPADFIAVRTRLVAEAKAADDRELAAALEAQRKPTAVAWLLNRVAREEPEVVTALLDLGGRMRTAQAKGDGATLSAVRPERHEAIDALIAAARRAAEEAGTPFGAAASDGVGATAVAVLADPASGQALSSGRLLRPLSYAGFGEVELDDAVALLRLVPAPDETDETDTEAPDAEAIAHERALTEARDALRESERELSSARLAHSEAVMALEEAAAEVERIEEEVAVAGAQVAEIGTRPDAIPASNPRNSAGS